MKKWTSPAVVGVFYEQPYSGSCQAGQSPDRDWQNARELFSSLDVPLRESVPEGYWSLQMRGKALSLVRPDGVKVTIDFAAGKNRAREYETGKLGQPLARATGIAQYIKRHGHPPHVIDATGGLGQDMWVLASLGCRLSVIERNPIIHALLANALERAQEAPGSTTAASRISLINDESVSIMQALAHSHEIHCIYLDPMYPVRKQKGDSKKGMQFLHALLGPEKNADETQADVALLIAALACEVPRVVVKRPRHAETLADPGHWRGQLTHISSPKTRYDIYHRQP